ncbi:DeoR/GlpR family DNA-binding transcription regulator [Anaeromicropila populeti]|uniref:Transcriptional regulator, DeoR family n=1 Tax=Anaeromicropila populeti TaxID=37658 RepID=A0A1I6IS32_9FIRM|nr:transcriptional regulator, DeoR family [Anaeromicropila populeti]
MLAEQRFEEIIRIVEEKKSVTVQELMEIFEASDSTIRRDLIALHLQGKLIKVHGGAIALSSYYNTKDDDVEFRQSRNAEDKNKIAKYAAQLIKANDFVYLDAGTTTGAMIPYITETTVTFVTNSISNAGKLIKAGCKVFIIGGEVKASTEAIAGNEAVFNLNKYNFTKGFFGTNGISRQFGFTTPDLNEAMVKKAALERCKDGYILGDSSKFNQLSPITFADFTRAKVITTIVKDDNYKNCSNILEVDAK